MRNDALFIDGYLMDLDDNTKITLKLKSNVFTEVSKIVSNNSYTIKLPKTVHNQKVIDNSDIPAYQSEFPYKSHRARYFRNGVEIIRNGQVVLMAVNESIEIALVWGNFVNFSNIVNQGLSLKDLPGDDTIYFERHNAYENYPNDKPYFYAYYNSRKYEKEEILNNNTDVTDRYRPSYAGREGAYPIHPVVRISWILEKVYERTGVKFDFSGKGQSLVNRLLIPLIDKKSNELTLGDNHECLVSDRSGFGKIEYKVKKGLELFEVNEVGAYGNYFKVKADSTVRFTFKGKLTFFYNVSANSRNDTWRYLRIVLSIDGEEILMATPRLGTGGINYGGWNTLEISGYCTNSLLNSQKAEVELTHVYASNFIQLISINKQIQNLTLSEASIECSPNVPDEVPFNSNFPIIYNLPDIKIIDLIKALSCLCGVFAKQDNGIVRFISLDDIYENKAKALNWTKRVVASYRDNKPKEISFEVSDYCQHNYFKWKEDDTVEGNYDGDLEVDNKALDYEKDSITLQFSATDGCNVPMYTFTEGTDGNEGTFQHNSCKPRLLKEIGGTWHYRRGDTAVEKSYALFDGLDFDTILNEKYEKLRNVLNHAVLIKENILVSEYDLKEFDESVPIYLGQYGKYFAVIEMKAEDNGIAEVQLLQL